MGLETVSLKGEPFTSHISVGDKGEKGSLMMEVDLDKMKAECCPLVLIANTADYSEDKIDEKW